MKVHVTIGGGWIFDIVPVCIIVLCFKNMLKVIGSMSQNFSMVIDPVPLLVFEKVNIVSTSSVEDSYVKKFGSGITFTQPINTRSNFPTVFFQFENVVVFIYQFDFQIFKERASGVI